MTWLHVKEPTRGFFQKPTWRPCFATLSENKFHVYTLAKPGSLEDNAAKHHVSLKDSVVAIQPNQSDAHDSVPIVRVCYQSEHDKSASEKGKAHFSYFSCIATCVEQHKKLVDTMHSYCHVVKSKSVTEVYARLTSKDGSKAESLRPKRTGFQGVLLSSSVVKQNARQDKLFSHIFHQSGHDALGWSIKDHATPYLFAIGSNGGLKLYEVTVYACVEVGPGTRVLKEVQDKLDPDADKQKFTFTVHGPFSEAGTQSPYHKSKPASTRRHRRKFSATSISVTLAADSEAERDRRTTEITRYIKWYEVQRLDSTKRKSKCPEIGAKGWLLVKEPKVFAKWTKRYCVLFATEKSKELVFHKSDTEGQQVGSLKLGGVAHKCITEVPMDPDGKMGMMLEVTIGRKKWLLRSLSEDSTGLDMWHFHLKAQAHGDSPHPAHDTGPNGSRLRRSSSDSRLLRSRHANGSDGGEMSSFADDGEFGSAHRSESRKRRSSSALFSPTRGSFLSSKEDVVSRSKWEVLSGNVPKECLSFSPYAAKILAESLYTDVAT